MTNGEKYMKLWQSDWNCFVRDVLKARLDKEQQAIVSAVQHNKMVAVASGTARGKDFVAACCAMCFMYLTPRFQNGNLVKNTKIALTAPTGRQVQNIMIPEISRLYRNAGFLPGRLMKNGIKTDFDEWFLTGFKADDNNTEAWSGFHAVNTMFIVTEASGIPENVYKAIEGNLQGNSRMLIVYNPNVTTGYAANAMKSERWQKFRLNSLNAENVIQKKVVIPGQVDYDWVLDKVKTWCVQIDETDFNEGEGDFEFDNKLYRPNDSFRVKVLGMFPKVDTDVIIPYEWIVLANQRWEQMQENGVKIVDEKLRIGLDVAGMGRDSSVWCHRYGHYVEKFEIQQSAGKADHMAVTGKTSFYLKKDTTAKVFIDTIGEGAGVYSRLLELGFHNAVSCKFSEGASGLHDITEQYDFANMRAYLYWCIRDWLNPKNGNNAALPENDRLAEELTSTHWKFTSNGSIIIEPKEDIKERIKRSPDYADSLANTFYPKWTSDVTSSEIFDDFL